MKKNLVLMAMAGVALAGCVNDVADVAQNQEQKKVKIAFDAPVLYDNSESRAEVYGEIGSYDHNGGQNTVTYPKDEIFIIYAIRHNGNIDSWPAEPNKCSFYGKAISYDESLDGWAPKTDDDKYIYWPTSEKLSFAATSPADLEQPQGWDEATRRTFGTDGLTINDFTVPEVGKQYDLLYSEEILNKTIDDWSSNSSSGQTYEGVPIQFKHALSSIHIAISKALDNNNNIILTSVTLNGVEGRGTFKSKVEDGEENWSPTESSSKVNYPILNGGNINFPFTTASGEGMHITELTGGDKANSLLIMPQNLVDGVELYVTYTVNGSPQNKTIKLNDVDNDGELDDINKWEMGKRYTYHLQISGSSESLRPIFFAPSTEGWENVETITVQL